MSKAEEILGQPALVSTLSGHQFYTKEWVLVKMKEYGTYLLQTSIEGKIANKEYNWEEVVYWSDCSCNNKPCRACKAINKTNK